MNTDTGEPGKSATTRHESALTQELLLGLDAYWRAANYLSVGQVYLRDKPLLRQPFALADVKHMLIGHWGTSPGQNFIYAHRNRTGHERTVRVQERVQVMISGAVQCR